MVQQVDDMVANLIVVTEMRRGRLAGVTIGVPSNLDGAEVAAMLHSRLSARGWPSVEIRIVPARAQLQLVSVEFER